MFERYTERARQAIVLAQDEARRLKHNYIGTEHILLGLLREQEGLAARVLVSFGVTTDDARDQIRNFVGEGDEVLNGQIPFTPRAKKAMELALREALSLGHNYVGTEHLLLGLVREGDGIGTRILDNFDVDAERVRNEIIRVLSPTSRVPRSDARKALAQIVNVLGPVVDCPHIKCDGCQAEMAEALCIAKEALA